MLDKCGGGTRYINRKQLESALVHYCERYNTLSVANARSDERDKRKSRSGGESIMLQATLC